MLSLCFIFFIVEEACQCRHESSRRPNKEQIKKQLLDSFVYNENIKKEDLSARVDPVEDCQEAMKIIEEYENTIKTNKKITFCIRTRSKF